MEIVSPYDDNGKIVSPYGNKKWVIEEEQHWDTMPEGDRIKYIDSTTGTSGTKSFNQFVPDSSHIPLSAAPKPVERGGVDTAIDTLGKFGEGTSKFVSGMIGLPVDAIAGAMRGVGLPVGDTPIGGSQSIRNALSKASMSGYDAPNTMLNRAAGTAGEYLPGVLAAPFFPGQASRVLSSITETLLPTLGATGGAIAAREGAPDNPYAEIAASAAGGFLPATAQIAASKLGTLPQIVTKRLGTAAPVNKQEFGPQAQKQAVGAVEEMVLANRELDKGFQYRDASGSVVRKGLPETVEEATQALPQAKAHVYQQFNAKQREAGKKGLMFSGDEFAAKLSTWRNNPDRPPSMADADKYLATQIDKYAGKTFTPQQIENELASINSRLKANFKNPDPNKVSSAMVDSELVKILNDQMDSQISLLASEGYGELRNSYRNLKSIEDRLNRSAVTQLNRLAKDPGAWLPKGWDMGWMLEMLGAVQTGHPSAALAGVAAIGGPRVRKWLVDPDRNMKAMFKEADKLVKPREQWSMGERTFVADGRPQLERGWSAEGSIVPDQPQLPPQPANRLEYTGRTGKPPVEAPWNPTLRTGQKPNVVTNSTTVQQAAPFDFEATLQQLVDNSGMSPIEARDVLLRSIKAEMLKRRQGVK